MTTGACRARDSMIMTFGPGENINLLVPNGSGKATAMEMMVGLARPDQGTAQILGTDPATATRTGLISTMLQGGALLPDQSVRDRQSTRLNSSHVANSYAVFCLKKKRQRKTVPSTVQR